MTSFDGVHVVPVPEGSLVKPMKLTFAGRVSVTTKLFTGFPVIVIPMV